MTPAEKNDLFESINRFLTASVSNDPTAATGVDLSKMLEASDEACDLYVECIHMSLLLPSLLASAPEEESDSFDTVFSSPCNEARTPLLPGFPNVAFPNTLGYLSAGWPMAYLVAAVVVSIGIAIAAITHVSQPEQKQFVQQSNALPSSPTVVGQITGMANCVWEGSELRVQGSGENASEENSPKNLKSPVSLGDRLSITSGLLEITYHSGAKVILQGPVTYEVESAAGGYLSVGKLTARLEHKATDTGTQISKSQIPNPKSPLFAVRTPTATITDLGTEFGVEVQKDGVTHTHVFVGTVTVAKIGSGTTNERVLHAGDAVRITRNDASPVAAPGDGRQFVRTCPSVIDHGDAYAQRVLSMQPAAYYRMEPSGDPQQSGLLIDSSPGGRHGMLHFSNEYVGEPYASGPIGHALRLRGPMSQDYAIVQNGPKAMGDRLTVSVWAYLLSRTQDRALITTLRGIHAASDDAVQLQFSLSVNVPPNQLGCLEGGVTQHDGRKIAIAIENEEFPHSSVATYRLRGRRSRIAFVPQRQRSGRDAVQRRIAGPGTG